MLHIDGSTDVRRGSRPTRYVKLMMAGTAGRWGGLHRHGASVPARPGGGRSVGRFTRSWGTCPCIAREFCTSVERDCSAIFSRFQACDDLPHTHNPFPGHPCQPCLTISDRFHFSSNGWLLVKYQAVRFQADSPRS